MHLLARAERRGGWLVAVIVISSVWIAPRPRIAPGIPPAPPAVPARQGAAIGPPRLDVNAAGAEQLRALPGIGPVLAARIVAHRERHGPFETIEELRAVRGIGPRLLERLKPHVVISPSASTAVRDTTFRR